LQRLEGNETADFYELVVERHKVAATVITSSTDPVEWLTMLADPLLAQSAVDRLHSSAMGTRHRGRVVPSTRAAYCAHADDLQEDASVQSTPEDGA
jgi:hypothetical protein